MPQAAPASVPEFPARRPANPAPSLGLAFLGRRCFEGEGVTEVWDGLIARLTADPLDAGAMLDLSTLLQMRGERDRGLELQAAALASCRWYRTSHGSGQGLRILALAIAGDLMTNTPIDFLLEGSDIELTTCYVDAGLPSPAEMPDHDVAFLAIGLSDHGEAILRQLDGAFDGWPQPVVNGRAERIAALTRDGVADRFAGHPDIACPTTRRVDRDVLRQVVGGGTTLAAIHADLVFPVIARPIASHAGAGLEKLDDPAGLAAYLAAHPDPEFFVTRFFDYSDADGRFRKLRVVLVDGRPFVSHMAVSARWMVHYLNADMGEAAHRAEEAEVMASFDQGFAARHAGAFQALSKTLGLDYFGIDCAETSDGRLLVFEVDVAMIVHAMDSADLYPYKKPAMAKLFSAFAASLTASARRGRIAA
ncbi:hypothetical protein [Phenylobacterium sp.]|uniref:ATP-grasp domain-containing protein n=1 Tax=Phenylobacterium sp. TaxID=1871053 RepID=UPI00286BAEBC|nr:hypothetical protein [Phenylobacterium sp.]